MNSLEKIVEVNPNAKARVDHATCCSCFGKDPKSRKIKLCYSKCCVKQYILKKASTFIRMITP